MKVPSLPDSDMVSFAVTHSAISVVNALATGKGAAIGIGLECRVRAELNQSNLKPYGNLEIKSRTPDSHSLASTSALFALKYLGFQGFPEGHLLLLDIESEIPLAVGLKSSSAVSVGVVQAVFKLFNQEYNPKSILDTSCSASKYCGASITGAYDDASASLLGGLVLTNNRKFAIMKHQKVPKKLGSIVLLQIPKKARRFTSSIDTKIYERFKKESDEAFEYARRMQIPQAMVENSIVQCAALGYSFRPITEALMVGASSAGISGKGPSVAAICANNKIRNGIQKIWLEGTDNIQIIESRIEQPITRFNLE